MQFLVLSKWDTLTDWHENYSDSQMWTQELIYDVRQEVNCTILIPAAKKIFTLQNVTKCLPSEAQTCSKISHAQNCDPCNLKDFPSVQQRHLNCIPVIPDHILMFASLTILNLVQHMGVYLLMAVSMKNPVSSTLRMEAGSSSKIMEHFCHTTKGLCALWPCRPQTHYIFMFIFNHTIQMEFLSVPCVLNCFY